MSIQVQLQSFRNFFQDQSVKSILCEVFISQLSLIFELRQFMGCFLQEFFIQFNSDTDTETDTTIPG